MITHCRYDRLEPTSNLKPHPKNRNQHPPEQITRLAQILQYQGIRAPIVVSNRSGFMVKGHGTLLAIIENGWDSAPVVFQDFESEEQEISYIISDNALSSWSELDMGQINLDIPDLGPDFDIELLGIENFTLDFSEKDLPEMKDQKEDKGKCPECGKAL